MVTSNLKLVSKFAQRWKTRVPKSSYPDLIQAGNLGLITAVMKFQPSKGYKLSTYAFFWIKRECDYWVQQREPALRPPTSAAAEAHRVRVAIREHQRQHGTAPTRAEIALATGLKPERLDNLKEWLAPVRSLDAHQQLDDGEADPLGETIAAPAGHDPEAAAACAAALAAMRESDPDAAALLELLTDAPMLQVAAAAGLGRHEIRRVQRDALARLRELPEVREALAAV